VNTLRAHKGKWRAKEKKENKERKKEEKKRNQSISSGLAGFHEAISSVTVLKHGSLLVGRS